MGICGFFDIPINKKKQKDGKDSGFTKKWKNQYKKLNL